MCLYLRALYHYEIGRDANKKAGHLLWSVVGYQIERPKMGMDGSRARPQVVRNASSIIYLIGPTGDWRGHLSMIRIALPSSALRRSCFL